MNAIAVGGIGQIKRYEIKIYKPQCCYLMNYVVAPLQKKTEIELQLLKAILNGSTMKYTNELFICLVTFVLCKNTKL